MTTDTMTKDTSTDVGSNENAVVDEAKPLKLKRGPGRPPGKMPKEEKPRKVKKWADDPLAYHRNYYREKLMHPCSCEICGREFTSICGYKRHKKECKTCKIIQKIREDAEQRDVSPDMVMKYREGDNLTDLLIKVKSL